jgi:hypothetical protein
VEEYGAQRELVLERVEQDEQLLHEALDELKVAVNRPFRIVERFAQNPAPWILVGMLIGFWLGGNQRSGQETELGNGGSTL